MPATTTKNIKISKDSYFGIDSKMLISHLFNFGSECPQPAASEGYLLALALAPTSSSQSPSPSSSSSGNSYSNSIQKWTECQLDTCIPSIILDHLAPPANMMKSFKLYSRAIHYYRDGGAAPFTASAGSISLRSIRSSSSGSLFPSFLHLASSATSQASSYRASAAPSLVTEHQYLLVPGRTLVSHSAASVSFFSIVSDKSLLDVDIGIFFRFALPNLTYL